MKYILCYYVLMWAGDDVTS